MGPSPDLPLITLHEAGFIFLFLVSVYKVPFKYW